MPVKVVTTNAPEADVREVSISEATDLARQGLLVPGEGDVDGEGRFDVQKIKDAEVEAEKAETEKRRKAARAAAKKES